MAGKQSTTAEEKYELYQQGHSLAQVAEVYGCTRNSIFGLFKYRGWAMRPKAKPKAYVEFNGSKYTVRNHGYLAKTNGDRTLMHRDVWEFHNGPIPQGWDIHHKDENKQNNELSNLECLPKAEHTRLYSPHNNQYTKGRKKEKCGA